MVISVNDCLATLAALAAERLFELALSARNARRALKTGAMEMGAGHCRANHRRNAQPARD
jgi:isoprenylcysteine carboxyl methyltransferase (ICMT) family protein YpbQ